ncbi:MAG: outer membrane protein assembly factor BamB, partial [Gammaproteobacteria bacterium]
MTTQLTSRARISLGLLLALSPVALANGSKGEDWPQWRGPQRTGISAEMGWAAQGASEPLWTKQLGLGHSSFAVVEGRVYTLGYDADAGLDSVFCLDAETGEELWRHTYASEIWDVAHDGGTLTTPTVVGDAVYTSNREAKVFCFDGVSGEVRWSRDLRADLELEPPTWGFSASPLVVEDIVVLNIDRVVALDRHTGEEAWVSETAYGIAYSTPTAFELEGRDYLAVLNGAGLAVLDRHDGLEVDLFDWVKEPQIYPMSPVIIDDRIFISAGYDRGSTMLRLADGKLSELWSSRLMRNKMSGSVLWEDHLFGFDESILKCLDLDGNERWRQRGMGTGSMSIAGGRLVILDGRGQVIVAEADPEAYVELSRQSVLEGGTSWSTPVLSHGRIYCRSSLGQMACLDHRGTQVDGAVSSESTAPKIPEATAIVARHIQAVHGREALERVKSIQMRGSSESLINTVRSGTIELDWDATYGFAWNDAAGIQFGYNSQVGWMIKPRSAPAVLKGELLDALHEAGDVARLFDPAGSYSSLGSVVARGFEGRECYAVSARTPQGYARTLYFDIESGLYAGHEGEGIPMWTVGAYQEFDGVLLPTRWSTYEPVRGERASATFEQVVVNPPAEESRFDAPEVLAPFLRGSEEVALDNQRLIELHAGVLGEWRSEEEA